MASGPDRHGRSKLIGFKLDLIRFAGRVSTGSWSQEFGGGYDDDDDVARLEDGDVNGDSDDTYEDCENVDEEDATEGEQLHEVEDDKLWSPEAESGLGLLLGDFVAMIVGND